MEMEGALPQAGNINELDQVTSSKPKYLSGDGYETRRIVERYHGRLICKFPSLRGSWSLLSLFAWKSAKTPGSDKCCLSLSAQFLYVVLGSAMNSSRTSPISLDSMLLAFSMD
jgi:hypothetical protein